MADTIAAIPDREWFKASEVCEIAGLQPYVLKSWELEFPALGVARTSGGARTYRRSDVERVLRIRHLVFVDGLTLAGARRRLDEDEWTAPGEVVRPAAGRETQDKLAGIKRDLRALLEMLDGGRDQPRPASWPPRAQPTLLEFEAGAVDANAAGGNGGKPAARKRGPRGK